MTGTSDYKVELDVFEGPLDLLLYLIKKDEVDIYNIPIERITAQYMEYLNLMELLDLDIAGEFIVMAATLMMIKSRMLLPVEDRPEMDDEDEIDPRWELVRQLVEYKRFKDLAGRLQVREDDQSNVFSSGGTHIVLDAEEPGVVLQDVTLFDLISAFRDVLRTVTPDEPQEIMADQYTVEHQLNTILETMQTARRAHFKSLFRPHAHRMEVICTFLALLELIRLRRVCVRQDAHFEEIMIEFIEQAPVLASAPAVAVAPDGGTEGQLQGSQTSC